MADVDTLEAPEVDEQDQQPAPNPGDDKLRILHTAIGKEYNLGSFDEFKQKIQDPAKRKAFYDAVGKQYNLGSYDEFEKKIGVGQQSTPNQPSTPPAPVPEHEVQHSPVQDIRHIKDLAEKPVTEYSTAVGG